MLVKEANSCRICGNKNLINIMNLGNHALSGRFPAKDEDDPPTAPLVLVKCNDKNNSACGLLQLKHNFSQDELYLHDYGYRSGLNKTMTEHIQGIAKEAESLLDLNRKDVVLDIGSNDATLLKSYSRKELIKIGIDPTGEQFKQFYVSDIKLVSDYFSFNNFQKVSNGKKAKVITSIAMFYDLPQPLKFISDIKNGLHPDGVWISEQSYMPFMLKTNSFDTICHEHLEYYALKQIIWMMKKVDLRVFDISFNDANGGSFRFKVCHEKGPFKSDTSKIESILEQEKKLELDTLKPYEEFKQRIEDIKKKVKNYLQKEKLAGRSIYIYGASTKGNTFLQYMGIDKSIIVAAADRNPSKYGRRTPATGIPIISEEEARKAKPDNFIVLPWHFKKEFIEREREYLRAGGKFLFPLPEFEVIGAQ